MSLIDSIRNESKAPAAKSTALEAIHHAGDRGGEREDLVQEFLEPRLPMQLGVGKGEIRSASGDWSKQGDLIVYDRLACPRLVVGARTQVFPVESVGAVIEVKTKLSSKTIREASDNISQARSMEKSGLATHIAPGSVSFGTPTPVLGGLFAFELGMSLGAFRKAWDSTQSQLPTERRINIACILGTMAIIHVDRIYHLWDKASEDLLGKLWAADCGEDSLLFFTLALLRALADFRFGVPDLFKHYFAGGGSLGFENAFQE